MFFLFSRREQAYQACRDALYVLGSMCDIEARPPRNLANALGEAGMGHGVGGGIPTSAALLSCGLPSSDLVKDTFGYLVDLCKVRQAHALFVSCASLARGAFNVEMSTRRAELLPCRLREWLDVALLVPRWIC